MHEHAKVIAGGIEGKDVCNIGFGLGLIDGELQQLKPRSHTIIEAHPDRSYFLGSKGTLLSPYAAGSLTVTVLKSH